MSIFEPPEAQIWFMRLSKLAYLLENTGYKLRDKDDLKLALFYINAAGVIRMAATVVASDDKTQEELWKLFEEKWSAYVR